MLETPVVYIVFNRPRHTRQTFAAIREIRPQCLFIVADGPRPDHPTDVERCRNVREIVANVDWPCTVYRDYAESNLGLKRRVSSGLNWAFKYVDRLIVLEDDCLPHSDFFRFCENSLDRYCNDNRICVVTGNNHQNGRVRGNASYYFSKYPHCWGWATWKRAWKYYQGELPFWSKWKNSGNWIDKIPDRLERQYWASIFDRVERGAIDSWAYPWTCCVWYHNGLTVTPNVNLVTNIGFGPEGTHTIAEEDLEGVPTYPLGEMIHPRDVILDRRADRYVFDYYFGGIHGRFHVRMINKVAQVIKKIFGIKNG